MSYDNCTGEERENNEGRDKRKRNKRAIPVIRGRMKEGNRDKRLKRTQEERNT